MRAAGVAASVRATTNLADISSATVVADFRSNCSSVRSSAVASANCEARGIRFRLRQRSVSAGGSTRRRSVCESRAVSACQLRDEREVELNLFVLPLILESLATRRLTHLCGVCLAVCGVLLLQRERLLGSGQLRDELVTIHLQGGQRVHVRVVSAPHGIQLLLL
jgi:hypothetical protein